MEGTPVVSRGFCFNTSQASYYYDDCSGQCFPWGDREQKALEIVEQSLCGGLADTEIVSSAPDPSDGRWRQFILDRYRAYNAFFDKPLIPGGVNSPTGLQIEEACYQSGLTQLLLTVAEACNLRCTYCTQFSEHYSLFGKRHSSKPKGMSTDVMSLETAKKAVRQYMSLLDNKAMKGRNDRGVINFYGGEPLTNLGLIKEVVAWVQQEFGDRREIEFQLTTNGVLLKPGVVDYLVANEFLVGISLDGPKEEQDKRRPMAGGRGSFDQVFRNLEYFWQAYPSYKNLIFLVTYDISTDLIALKDFFNSRDEFRDAAYLFSTVRSTFSQYFDQFDHSVRDDFVRTVEKLREDITADDPVTRNLIASPLLRLMVRPIVNGKPSWLPSTGSCSPGYKISVQVDGSLDTCERTNDLSVGHVDSGLDFGRMARIVGDFNKAVRQGCSYCSVRRLCGNCFSSFWDGEEFRRDESHACRQFAVRQRESLSRLYELFEMMPHLHEDWMDRFKHTGMTNLRREF